MLPFSTVGSTFLAGTVAHRIFLSFVSYSNSIRDDVTFRCKEDQCAMVFSGTSGLADITTDFTFNVFHPRDYLPCGLHGVHEGFFNDVQQFMLTLILFSTGPV